MKRKNKIIILIAVAAIIAIIVCDVVIGITVAKKHRHSYVESVTPPTCTEQGYTTYTCECGDSYKDNYINAIGHTPANAVKENEVDSTCTAEGSYDEVIYCSVCNTEIIRTPETINKKQHTPAVAVIENEVDSTCTAEGSYEEVICCSDCHTELSRIQIIISAKGHSYKDGACSACGELQTKGLDFTKLPDGTYSVSKGSATDGNVIIPSLFQNVSVTAIGDSAFFNCSNLTSITIPDSVTTIGKRSFSNCSNLTSLTIPDSVISISEWAFCACDSLTSITQPKNLQTIERYAFARCASLECVAIPDGVTTIGKNAFSNCSNLTSITIPVSVTFIDDLMLASSFNLAGIYYGGTSEDWENISIGSNNTQLNNATRYYYSDTKPSSSGNYWHYLNGNPEIW